MGPGLLGVAATSPVDSTPGGQNSVKIRHNLPRKCPPSLHRALTLSSAWVRLFGSPEQRIYDLNNQIKHPGSWASEGSTAVRAPYVIWLTREGIRSSALMVTYAETAGFLAEVAGVCSELQAPGRLVRDAEKK